MWSQKCDERSLCAITDIAFNRSPSFGFGSSAAFTLITSALVAVFNVFHRQGNSLMRTVSLVERRRVLMSLGLVGIFGFSGGCDSEGGGQSSAIAGGAAARTVSSGPREGACEFLSSR